MATCYRSKCKTSPKAHAQESCFLKHNPQLPIAYYEGCPINKAIPSDAKAAVPAALSLFFLLRKAPTWLRGLGIPKGRSTVLNNVSSET